METKNAPRSCFVVVAQSKKSVKMIIIIITDKKIKNFYIALLSGLRKLTVLHNILHQILLNLSYSVIQSLKPHKVMDAITLIQSYKV